MNKNDIEKWCKVNNYLLVDLNRDHVPPEQVKEIASVATGIISDDITKKVRQGEIIFARYLGINYLWKYYGVRTLGRMFNLDHSTVSNARKQMLDSEKNILFFKTWQQNAIRFFNSKIKEIEDGKDILQKTGE
jgi:chromosomal replication initiation ATPase DnaA